MTTVAHDAARARLTAAQAFREACECRHYAATAIRSAYLFDPMKPLPHAMLAKLQELDE